MVVIMTVIAISSTANAFSIGSRGQEVKDLQITLIEAGFDIPAITSGGADFGYFGVQTEKALAAYEASKPSLKLGAAAGPDVYFQTLFHGGLTQGGNRATTSLASLATYTTRAADFQGVPSVYQWNNGVNMTVTLSGTSTHEYIPQVGDVSTVYFRNASSTAGSTITFAAENAGVDLQFAEATGGDLVLNGLDWAKLTLIRTSANLVTIIFDEFTEAD